MSSTTTLSHADLATNARRADYSIHPLFIERWSPRAYTEETIPDSILFALFEAARWAPSGSNDQPWRFLYSKKGSAAWQTFLDLLLPGNQRRAAQASALVVLVSKKIKIGRDGGAPSPRAILLTQARPGRTSLSRLICSAGAPVPSEVTTVKKPASRCVCPRTSRSKPPLPLAGRVTSLFSPPNFRIAKSPAVANRSKSS